MEKYYNEEGLVAIIYSPGFGAGWSTWNSEYGSDIVFDKELVQAILTSNLQAFQDIIDTKYKNAYMSNRYRSKEKDLRDLFVIAWLTPGTLFRISEYDGSEDVITYDIDDYLIA